MRTPSRRTVFHIITIIASAVVVYHNTLNNDFHLDGIYGIVKNREIRRIAPVHRHFVDPRTISSLDRITQYRPLLPLTLSINYHLAGGYSRPGYHVANILFHGIAGIIVYFFCLELLGEWCHRRFGVPVTAEFLALAVAVIFVVHPVSAFPVNYVFARDVILMTAFLFGAFLSYIRMRRRGDSVFGWTAALLLLALSLLSKTNAVVMPVLVFLFEYIFTGQGLKRKELWLRPMPFACVALAFFSFTRVYLDFSDLSQAVNTGISSFWEYPLTQAKVHVFHYLRNVFWPFYIRALPNVKAAAGLVDPGVIIGLGIISGTLIFGIANSRKRPVLSFAILAYWTALAPTSSVVPLYYSAAHYRPYPGSPFLILSLWMFAFKLIRVRYHVASLVLAGLYFGLSTMHLNGTWRTGETLWAHSIKYGGDATAHMNYALSLKDATDPRKKKHLQEALRGNQYYVLAKINLGLLHLDTGESEAGLQLLEEAASLAPGWAQCHFWLSHAYDRIGNTRDAFVESERAAALDPRNIEYQYKAAWNAQAVREYEKSLTYLEVVEDRDPGFRQTLFLKGFALQMVGDLKNAVESYRHFLALKGAHHQVHFNLGHALMTDGRCPEAVEHFRKTLELMPGYNEARLHLAACLERQRPGSGNDRKANGTLADVESPDEP